MEAASEAQEDCYRYIKLHFAKVLHLPASSMRWRSSSSSNIFVKELYYITQQLHKCIIILFVVLWLNTWSARTFTAIFFYSPLNTYYSIVSYYYRGGTSCRRALCIFIIFKSFQKKKRKTNHHYAKNLSLCNKWLFHLYCN